MKAVHTGWRLALLWLGLLQAAAAQSTNEPSSSFLGLSGRLTQSACNLMPALGTEGAPLLLSMPALPTSLLLDAPFSPVAQLPLRFALSATDLACLKAVVGSSGNHLVFDVALASVVARNGLLRNSAVVRPAQNVLVQLGLIGADGMFTPLDLNQPQALNAAWASQPLIPGAQLGLNLGLNLGVRYVAARYVSETYAIAGAPNFGASDVTPGNVSVFLPFVVNLK